MLCYAMLCYAMLCYAMLCYAMLCYAMLCYDLVGRLELAEHSDAEGDELVEQQQQLRLLRRSDAMLCYAVWRSEEGAEAGRSAGRSVA